MIRKCYLLFLASVFVGTGLLFLPQMISAQEATYVGSQTCGTCHGLVTSVGGNQYTTWFDTKHTMQWRDPDDRQDQGLGVVTRDAFVNGLDLATDESFAAFGANAPVLSYDDTDDRDPDDEDSGYRVTIGDTTYDVHFTLGGTGDWKQRYMTRIGNSIYILPIQYNEETGDWVTYKPDHWYDSSNNPLPAVAPANSYDRRCAGCHSVNPEVAFDDVTGEWTATITERNIGCEACHGPGSNHLMSGGNPADILNPNDIADYDRRLEVCGSCHSGGSSTASLGGRTLGYPYSDTEGHFMPGDVLADFAVQTTSSSDFWPNEEPFGRNSSHHQQQYNDFITSQHYAISTEEEDKASANSLDHALYDIKCWTCHDPHGDTEHKHMIRDELEIDGIAIVTDNDDNTLCLACHAGKGPFDDITTEMVADPTGGNFDTISSVVSDHTNHPYDPTGTGASRCSKCHNPKIAKSAVEYDIHAHTFWVNSPAQTLDLGMPNSCAVSCHMKDGFPNFGIDFSMDNVADWTEPTDTALADTLLHYYGPGGVWFNTDIVYRGVERCAECHETDEEGFDQVGGWRGTNHGKASEDTHGIESCNECHSTGYDTEVDNGGYDDFSLADPPDEEGKERMKNVQCESCHGPAGNHPAEETVAVYPDPESEFGCAQCHERTRGPTVSEWKQAAHSHSNTAAGGRVATTPSCSACHTLKGFMQFAEQEGMIPENIEPPASVEESFPLVCAACHDPHEKANESQLRVAAEDLCAKCHNPEDAVPPDNPHHSTASMLAGIGGYEYPGFTYENSAHTTADVVQARKCVRCHVFMNPADPSADPPLGANTGHTFEPRLVACKPCHPGIESFDYKGRQTEIRGLLAQLQARLDLATEAETETDEYQYALFNHRFVTNERSFGVHNTNYARGLLVSTLQNYRPGLVADINLDGEVNVLDLLLVIDVILGRVTDPATIVAADLTGDGNVNVADLVAIIRVILALQSPTMVLASNGSSLKLAEISLQGIQIGGMGLMNLPLMAKLDGDAAAAVFVINYDSNELSVAKPVLGKSSGLNLISEISDDMVVAVIFGANGKFIEAGESSLISIPVTVRGNGVENGISVKSAQFIAANGETVEIGEGSLASSPPLPKAFALNQNYPNPFNPSTTVSFAIPGGKGAVKVALRIYDARGRLVTNLVDEEMVAGNYSVVWDGTNDRGETASSGVYFYNLRADNFTATRKMVILK